MNIITDNDLSHCDDKECHLLFYFTAEWCGPCKKIRPLIDLIGFGADPTKLEVYLIDIDENDTIASEFKIRSVPSFHLYKNKKLIGSVDVSDIKKVKELLLLIK